MIIAGWLWAIPGALPTLFIACGIFVVGALQVTRFSVMQTRRSLDHESKVGEKNVGETFEGEVPHAEESSRFPQPRPWLVGAIAPHPPASRVDRRALMLT